MSRESPLVSVAATVEDIPASTKSKSKAPAASVNTCATRTSTDSQPSPDTTESCMVNVTGIPPAGLLSTRTTRPWMAIPSVKPLATGLVTVASGWPRASVTPLIVIERGWIAPNGRRMFTSATRPPG